MMLATGVGGRASEEAVGLRKEDGTQVGRSGQQAVVWEAWKTGLRVECYSMARRRLHDFGGSYYFLLLRDEVCGTSGERV